MRELLMPFPLVYRASTFATKKHVGKAGIRNNKAEEPYIIHLAEVAYLVREAGGSDIEIASAWLHDVVEDTEATLEDILEFFGREVAEIVDGLTDPKEIERLPTLERKTLQAERVRGKSPSVKMVKVADQISNLRCVVVDPPVKWPVARCIEYIEGAHRIWLSCCNTNYHLDMQFARAHFEATEKYNIPR